MLTPGALVTLAGRVGRDPDVRYFESGAVVVSFSLAVNRRKKDAPPDWFDLKIWGRTAEVAANYVRKGSLIAVTGQLGLETWTDKATGDPREKPVVQVETLSLLGSGSSNNSNAAYDEEF